MTEAASPSAEDVIAKYMSLRSRKAEIKAACDERVKKLDDAMAKLEAWLQMKMSVDKTNALPTNAGTAYKATVEHASVTDMDALLDFIKKNEAWHLVEKRVSKSGVKGYLDEGQPIPPGVNWYTSTAIHVRKPNER